MKGRMIDVLCVLCISSPLLFVTNQAAGEEFLEIFMIRRVYNLHGGFLFC